MGFFTRMIGGLLVGAVIGYAVAMGLPLDGFDSGIATMELPVVGEVNRITVFLTGMCSVLGSGFTLFLTGE